MTRTLLCFMLASVPALSMDCNPFVLAAVKSMPIGGGYSTSSVAHDALIRSVNCDGNQITVSSYKATPSFCSSATYAVLLETISRLQRSRLISLSKQDMALLLPGHMKDGESFWGRWNANGPGTARLFAETSIGINFADFANAKPGDFMKIFWSDKVGKDEHGHSVVFLGIEDKPDGTWVRFWSSNTPGGYGEKEVRRSKIAKAIFSRLVAPERLASAHLPPIDDYLASLLIRNSSFDEACRLSGIRQ